MLPVLKWNTMGIHKSKIGNAGYKLVAHRNRFRVALAKKYGQPSESIAPFLLNVRRSGITREENTLGIAVRRNNPREPQRYFRMALDGFVLCAGKKQPRRDLLTNVDGAGGPAQKAWSMLHGHITPIYPVWSFGHCRYR